MIATTATRVAEHTDQASNQRINRQTQVHIEYFRAHPEQIDRRLSELDEEWDIERALATASSCLSLFGLAMSALRSRKWLGLPLVVQSFYLQHTLQGWCPPLPALRRLGFRTAREIDHERCELKRLRPERS